MKKILVIFALLAVSFASVNAQENLKWGATLGMNSSNFSGDAFSSKVGFHAGVKAEVGLPQIAEGVYLDLGALLSLKGAKVNLGSYDIKYNPCYLEIPVHMGYKYAVNENFAVSAMQVLMSLSVSLAKLKQMESNHQILLIMFLMKMVVA